MAKRQTDECFREPSTGIVHIIGDGAGGEYTLCGMAFDEPSTERGEEWMVECNDVPTCEECIETARNLLPRLKKLIRKIDRKGQGK